LPRRHRETVKESPLIHTDRKTAVINKASPVSVFIGVNQ
jgi:hypothetical protein